MTHLIALAGLSLMLFAFDYIGVLYCGCCYLIIDYLAVSSTVLQMCYPLTYISWYLF
jgi:hypothetical protein